MADDNEIKIVLNVEGNFDKKLKDAKITVDKLGDEVGKTAKDLGVLDKRAAKTTKDLSGLDKKTKQTSKDMDKLAKSEKKAAKETEKVGKKAKKAAKQLDGLGKKAKKTKGAFDKFGFAMKSGVVAIGLGTLVVGVKKAVEAINQLGKIEGAEAGLESLARKSGTSSAALLKDLEKVTLGTISQTELMLKAVDALNLGLSPSEFTRVAGIASGIALKTGKDLDFLLESISTGISRQSRQFLDNAGIVLSAGQAYEEYADSVGKAVNQLTDMEKRQAFTNAALTQGEEKVKALGEAEDNAATSAGRMSAAYTDLGTELLKALGPVLKEMSDRTTRLLVKTRDLVEAWRMILNPESFIQKTTNPFSRLNDDIDETAKRIKEIDKILTAPLTLLLGEPSIASGEKTTLGLKAEQVGLTQKLAILEGHRANAARESVALVKERIKAEEDAKKPSPVVGGGGSSRKADGSIGALEEDADFAKAKIIDIADLRRREAEKVASAEKEAQDKIDSARSQAQTLWETDTETRERFRQEELDNVIWLHDQEAASNEELERAKANIRVQRMEEWVGQSIRAQDFVRSAFQSTAAAMGDAIGDQLVDGTGDLRSAMKSVLKTMISMAAQALIIKGILAGAALAGGPLGGGLSFLFAHDGSSNIGGGGGETTKKIPRYHDGISSSERFAVLERKEAVITKEAMAQPGARQAVDGINSRRRGFNQGSQTTNTMSNVFNISAGDSGDFEQVIYSKVIPALQEANRRGFFTLEGKAS